MKGIVVILLIMVVASLGKALSSMSGEAGPERAMRMVQALTWRVVLSAALLLLLIAGNLLGWISPH
jgi:DUF2909 family protein